MYKKGERPIIVVCASTKDLPNNTNLLGYADVLDKLQMVEEASQKGINPYEIYTFDNGFSWNGRTLLTPVTTFFSPRYMDGTDALVYQDRNNCEIYLELLLDGYYKDYFKRQYKLGHSFPKLLEAGEFEISKDYLYQIYMNNKRWNENGEKNI